MAGQVEQYIEALLKNSNNEINKEQAELFINMWLDYKKLYIEICDTKNSKLYEDLYVNQPPDDEKYINYLLSLGAERESVIGFLMYCLKDHFGYDWVTVRWQDKNNSLQFVRTIDIEKIGE